MSINQTLIMYLIHFKQVLVAVTITYFQIAYQGETLSDLKYCHLLMMIITICSDNLHIKRYYYCS
jgi:hypothetical protein